MKIDPAQASSVDSWKARPARQTVFQKGDSVQRHSPSDEA